MKRRRAAARPARPRRPPATAPTTTWAVRRTELVLTGIVTTNDVVVSPQIGGRSSELLVDEGDTVKQDQLVAVIAPDELQRRQRRTTRTAPRARLAGAGERGGAALPGAADGRADHAGRVDLAATEAQQMAADGRSRERAARASSGRSNLVAEGRRRRRRSSIRRARRSTRPRRDVDALKKQVEAQRAARRAGARQRRADRRCAAARCSRRSSSSRRAAAQRTKADVRLALHRDPARRSTASSTCARRAPAKSSTPGSRSSRSSTPTTCGSAPTSRRPTSIACASATSMTVRLPSGDEREGDVFYRGVDAGVRDAARRQPHQARHQDVRDPAARRQQGPPPRRRHDGVRAAAAEVAPEHG